MGSQIELLAQELETAKAKLSETEIQLVETQSKVAETTASWELNHNQWQQAWDDQQQTIYATEQEAEARHARALAEAIANAESRGRIEALQVTEAHSQDQMVQPDVKNTVLLQESQFENEGLKTELKAMT